MIASPMPPVYPEYIGHTELALQKLVCVDAPGRTTADLWRDGSAAADVPWSYRPVAAWLKPF
eukprot:2336287-Prymnesium_polylepis.1